METKKIKKFSIEEITEKLADYDAAHQTTCGKDILDSFLCDLYSDMVGIMDIYDNFEEGYEQAKREMNVTEIPSKDEVKVKEEDENYNLFELLGFNWEVKE